MILGKNINKDIRNLFSEYDNSIWSVLSGSIWDSTTYDVYKSINDLVIRPVVTPIQPINNGR